MHNSNVAAMNRTLEAIGEAGTDIVPIYFKRFYARFAEQAANFHNRASSEGTMVTEMLSMLTAQAGGEEWVPTIMRAQVITHHDHGDIPVEAYREALELLVAVLAEAAGPSWDAAQESAWREEAETLYALIARYY